MVRRGLFTLPVAVAAVLWLTVPSVAADRMRVRDVDTARFPLVGLYVSAPEGVALAKDAISVTENGRQVPVVDVTGVGLTQGSASVDAVLAIDVSNSMRGVEIETALGAANRFVERIPSWISVGVVAFAAESRVTTPLTDDRDAVVAGLRSVKTGTTSQGTALYDAIVTASRMFSGDAQHNIILLTDGRNTQRSVDFDDAVAVANDAGVTVVTIGLDGPETDVATLASIAGATRGTFTAIQPSQLDAAYESLALELASQFVVTYRSSSPNGVAVTVEIQTPSGLAETRFVTPSPVVSQELDQSFLLRLFTGTPGTVLAVGLTFLAALSLLTFVFDARFRAAKIAFLRSRTGMPPPPSPRRGQQSAGSAWIPQQLADIAERGTEGTGVAAAVARKLQRAGLNLRVGEFVIGVVLAVGAAAFIGSVAIGPAVGAALALIATIAPWAIVSRLARKRIGKLQEQLPDLLMVLASSLRAGHSFLQALDTATKEIGEPAAGELGRALAEIRLGRNVEDALNALAARIGSQDLEWAITAIEIQRKVGGNLAEVLETVSKTIRERETLRRQVKVLSAEGRLSVTILTVLPFLLALYLMAVNPDYLRTLTGTPIGILLIIGALTLMGVGYLWMRKIVRLDA